MVDKALIVALRNATSASIGDCRDALEEAGGDLKKAEAVLRAKGVKTAEKKAGRSASDGAIVSYIHGQGKVGVLLELNCETDFVARTDAFQALARDIAMHIAASAPDYVRVEDVPPALIEQESAIVRAELVKEGKPEAMIGKILEGKLKKWATERCLLEQMFVKDDTKTVAAVLQEGIATLGENMSIRRFTRYVLGA